MKQLMEMCVFCADVLAVYKKVDSISIRNDLHNKVIIPTMDIVEYDSRHFKIGDGEYDLGNDCLPEIGSADTFMEQVTPEMAYDYLRLVRLRSVLGKTFDDCMTNQFYAESSSDGLNATEKFLFEINQMKLKLDIASELLEISMRTHCEKLVTIQEDLSAIIREIYASIVPKTSDAVSYADEAKVEREPEKDIEEVIIPEVDDSPGDSADEADFVSVDEFEPPTESTAESETEKPVKSVVEPVKPEPETTEELSEAEGAAIAEAEAEGLFEEI